MKRHRLLVPLMASGLVAAWLLVSAGPAPAQCEAGRKFAAPAPPEAVTIYTAKKILTMERGNPEATAVAVAGKRILAVGSLDEVKAALGDVKFTVNDTFQSKVVLPGLIDQHLHPFLGALTLATEVIATEDWVLPGRTFKAANSSEEYLARLKAADAALPDQNEWLFSWGYHKLWHGKLDRKTLDAVSATRPIMIWQRSCHEFYLNTAAIKALGLTEAAMQGKGDASKMFNWEEGHWWETGLNLVIQPILKVFATPERMVFGLKQMVAYLHQNGVTAYMEPGALLTPDIWKLYQQILGAENTPFYSYFVVDGRAQVDSGLGLAESLADTEKQIAMAPQGKVSFFPRQIKLFADGAIISQLMQMQDGYTDGHHGEWMMTPKNLDQRAQLYWNAGYQLHTHVNGDLGLETVLNVLERRMRENPRARPPLGHRPLRLLHRGAGGAHRPARRHRQRQPLLHRGFRRQVCQGRPRPAARRCHGALRLGAETPHPALLPLRPAHGAQRPAQFCLVCGQSRHALRPRGRSRAAYRRGRRPAGRHHRVGVFVAEGERTRQHRPRQDRQLHGARAGPPGRRADEAEGHPDLGHGLRGQDFPGPRQGPQVRRRERRTVARLQLAARWTRGRRRGARGLPLRSGAAVAAALMTK